MREAFLELPQFPHGNAQHGTDGVIIVCGVFHVGIYSKKSFIFFYSSNHFLKRTHLFDLLCRLHAKVGQTVFGIRAPFPESSFLRYLSFCMEMLINEQIVCSSYAAFFRFV